MKIPAYSSTIRRAEMDAVLTCMVDEKVGPGEINCRLTELVEKMFSFAYTSAFRSPAIALRYALQALDLSKNALVMLSALAPRWQYLEVVRLGLTPFVLDVDLHTALPSIDVIEAGIKKGAQALVLHMTLGLIPNMNVLHRCGVPVIEDFSQSVGSIQNDKKIGTNGVFSILGLEEKDMLTAGGGAVLCATEKKNASVLKKLSPVPEVDLLPDINASLAFVQLKQMEKNVRIRRELYEIYFQALSAGVHKTFLQSDEAVIYAFPVIFEHGVAEAKKFALRKGVQAEFAFEDSIVEFLSAKQRESLPFATSLARRVLRFPLYPRLGTENAQRVARVISSLP